MIALKNLVSQRKYIDEHEYWYVENNRFPYRIIYSDVVVDNNRARAAIEIELALGNAYPPFIESGKQSFELEKQDGAWKIIKHVYEGLNQFEHSTSELIPELTIEQIASEIDKQYLSD